MNSVPSLVPSLIPEVNSDDSCQCKQTDITYHEMYSMVHSYHIYNKSVWQEATLRVEGAQSFVLHKWQLLRIIRQWGHTLKGIIYITTPGVYLKPGAGI